MIDQTLELRWARSSRWRNLLFWNTHCFFGIGRPRRWLRGRDRRWRWSSGLYRPFSSPDCPRPPRWASESCRPCSAGSRSLDSWRILSPLSRRESGACGLHEQARSAAIAERSPQNSDRLWECILWVARWCFRPLAIKSSTSQQDVRLIRGINSVQNSGYICFNKHLPIVDCVDIVK